MVNNETNFKNPIKEGDITLLQDGFFEILHSEYRDTEVKGKYYAFVRTLDPSGSYDDFWVSDDYDTPEEALKGIQEEIFTEFRKLLVKKISEVK